MISTRLSKISSGGGKVFHSPNRVSLVSHIKDGVMFIRSSLFLKRALICGVNFSERVFKNNFASSDRISFFTVFPFIRLNNNKVQQHEQCIMFFYSSISSIWLNSIVCQVYHIFHMF